MEAEGTKGLSGFMTRVWRAAAAVISGLLVASAFPPMGSMEAAWFGLFPLILVARFSDSRTAFRYGFLSGLVAWCLALGWLLRLSRFGTPWPVVASGWLLLSAYCALYTGAFALVVSQLWKEDATDAVDDEEGGEESGLTGKNLIRVVLIPLIWVGFEYLRSTLFTGFSWNALGVSQYRNLSVIQLAEWGGVYLVSGVLVMMNAAISMTVMDALKFRRVSGGSRRRIHGELMLALFVVVLSMMFGLRRLAAIERGTEGQALRVAVIQGNIPQQEKWTEEYEAGIYGRMRDLTEKAAVSAPDLVLWPETVVPRSAVNDPWTRDWVADLATQCGPILLGSMSVDRTEHETLIYNSSVLFERDGRIAGEYRKRHLVPFGEYLPGDRWIPLLKRFAPLGYSCAAGTVSTVFSLDQKPLPFSSMICFEDTMAGIARDAVNAGARLLINQTNDAWFEDSSAAVQHMSHCVFRCVENRVPAVRAANMGVSCFIRPSGMLDETTKVLLREGVAESTDYRVDEVIVSSGLEDRTFYTRHGDWAFALPCGVMCAGVLILLLVKSRKKV